MCIRDRWGGVWRFRQIRDTFNNICFEINPLFVNVPTALRVNNVDVNDIYQTRPWISIRVVYTAATQGISVVNRGRVSIEPNNASGNSIGYDSNAGRWSIVWTDAHPHGDEYIAQYCLYNTIGFIHSGFFDNKTFIMITKNSSGTQTPLNFNLTIF